jgi:uncharacterized membrane protein YeiH
MFAAVMSARVSFTIVAAIIGTIHAIRATIEIHATIVTVITTVIGTGTVRDVQTLTGRIARARPGQIVHHQVTMVQVVLIRAICQLSSQSGVAPITETKTPAEIRRVFCIEGTNVKA